MNDVANISIKKEESDELLSYQDKFLYKVKKNLDKIDKYNFEIYIDVNLDCDSDTRKSSIGFVMAMDSGPLS